MKKQLFLILILAPILSSAQLKNLDFELWEPSTNSSPSVKPEDWTCSIRYFGTNAASFSDHFYTPADSNAQNNNLAIKLCAWYYYLKDAAVQRASIDYRPEKLNGFYIYQENIIDTNNIVDTAEVSVALTKWNSITSKNDTVGFGKLQIYEEVTAYQNFSVNIHYYTDDLPDSITVFLDPSLVGRYLNRNHQANDDGVSSFLTIDNLSLSGEVPTGIQKFNSKNQDLIFPNPAADQIHFEAFTGTLVVRKMDGSIIQTIHANQLSALDLSEFESGIYVISFQSENNTKHLKFEKL